jgi:hypothetical protein
MSATITNVSNVLSATQTTASGAWWRFQPGNPGGPGRRKQVRTATWRDELRDFAQSYTLSGSSLTLLSAFAQKIIHDALRKDGQARAFLLQLCFGDPSVDSPSLTGGVLPRLDQGATLLDVQNALIAVYEAQRAGRISEDQARQIQATLDQLQGVIKLTDLDVRLQELEALIERKQGDNHE